MTYIGDLRRAVDEATPRLLALGDASARRRAPGAWSPREIIGHLVDSASNNHQRFIRGQFQDDLIFAGYAQDQWVAAGRYQDAPWEELVTLWRTFNLQLARVMEGVPDEARLRPRLRHNLDQIGFATVPQGEPATLDHLMRDYVTHLEHHLAQIFGNPSATRSG
jgi:DinB superfamily